MICIFWHTWMAWSREFIRDGVPWQVRQCSKCGIRQNRQCY